MKVREGLCTTGRLPRAVVVLVEKLFDVVGEEVGVVSLVFDFFTVDDKDGVFVVALAAKADPAFKAGFGIAAGQVNAFGSVVYFSKEARAISGFLQLLGPGCEVGRMGARLCAARWV